MLDVDALARWAAGSLMNSSFHGALAVLLVWIVIRGIPRMPPALQAALWWLVALKLLLALLPLPPVPVPLLPASATTTAAGALQTSGHTRSGVLADARISAPQNRWAHPAAVRSGTRTDVDRALAVLIAVWLVGVGLHGLRLITGLFALRSVLRRSRRPEDADLAQVVRLAATLRLRRVPDVRVSAEIDTPQVAGVWRPTVLLPASRHAGLTPAERTMALCHELVHVRRHDVALGWVPALAERLFFFHPLARFAARQFVTVREAACDAEVVRTLRVPRGSYARLLVRLGVAGPAPAFSAGGAAYSRSSLRRRLKMLENAETPGLPRRWTWVTVMVALLGLLPFQLVAQVPSQQALTPAAAQGATEPLTARRPAAALAPQPSTPRLLPARPNGRDDGAAAAQPAVPADADPVDDTAFALFRALTEHEDALSALHEQDPFDLESLRPHLDAIHRQIREIARETTEHQRAARHAEEAARRLQEMQGRSARLMRERESLARQQQRARQASETSRRLEEAKRLEERTQLVREQLEQTRRERQTRDERSLELRRIQRDTERPPHRAYAVGDVVVLRAGSDGTRPPPSRVLAVAGDRIHVSRSGILVNGLPASDLSAAFLEGLPEDAWEQVIPDGHYFVAAEHREPSSVIRFWGLISAGGIAGMP